MTFSQLNYVLEVSRCGSINKAAAKLFVSQSNLSNSIHELEKELDIKIFLRSSKGIELTPDGSEFLSYIRPLIEQHKHIMTLYEQKTAKPCLRLSVATQRYPFAVKAFTELLDRDEYPKYEMRIKETGIYQIIEDVYNNDCSIGVIFISRESEDFIRKTLENRNLVFNILKAINPRVYVRKGHPLAEKEIIHFHQLINYPYVVFDHGQGKSLYYTEEVNLAGFKIPEKLIFVHDRATMYNIVSHSDAFSIGSGILSEGFCDDDIISVPVECNSGDVMKLGWIKHANRKLNEIEEMYIKQLEESLKNE
ncbi:MAG: LysR family transcriptional regulator [Oscillospiraceae bacterium]|nr:LysR family transcriptional regulator [Oscillospiraceae bacterium]